METTGPAKKKPRGPVDNKFKGFSKGEKDLYREISQIEHRDECETRAAEERTRAYFQAKSYGRQMPTPSKKHENKEAFGRNSELALVEWEKNQIKPLYREFDKDKKGATKEQLVLLMAKLQLDEAIIGKVPFVPDNAYAALFEAWEPKDDKIAWEVFREGCNEWEWRLTDRDELERNVEEFFAKAYKFKM